MQCIYAVFMQCFCSVFMQCIYAVYLCSVSGQCIDASVLMQRIYAVYSRSGSMRVHAVYSCGVMKLCSVSAA